MKSWDQLTQLEQSECMYSDMYKDVYGVRPRFDQSDWTVEDYDREFVALQQELKFQEADDKIREAEAIDRFEGIIEYSIKLGAGSRETAIRWIMNGEQDVPYFEFCEGLPYGYIAKTSDIEQIFAKEVA